MKRSMHLPEMTQARARKLIRLHAPWTVLSQANGSILVATDYKEPPGVMERLELARAVGKLLDDCGKGKGVRE